MGGRKRLKRALVITGAVLIIFFTVLVVCLSPIAKYVIEKNSEKWLGRKIELSWIYINPFTGYVYISSLKIHEYQSDSMALSAKSLSASFALLKMLRKTYEIQQITL